MNNTTKRAYFLYAFIVLFLAGLVFMFYSFYTNGEEWASKKANAHLYSDNQLINAGSVYDRNGEVLAYSQDGNRIYHKDQTVREALLHAIGDPLSYISTGAQSVYSSQLSGYNFVDGVYNMKKYSKGSDLSLTLDAEICTQAYEIMGDIKGTVAVYNYKTGEIICMVSTPSFDPINKPEDIDTNSDYYGAYLNKFISGSYIPGSTFKCITAICAIENIPDLDSRVFKCEGSITLNGGTVKCNSTHGTIDFETGFNRSCNCVFAQLAAELGEDKLTATANELGFNTKNTIGSVSLTQSSFNIKNADDVNIGWAGIGQYTTLVNPCHMLTIMGAIANHGTAIKPFYVRSYIEPDGTEFPICTTEQSTTVTLNKSTADRMVDYMRSNVENYYGDDEYFNGLEMCGKTGTAQLDNGEPHSWFVGFSADPETPYAVVCVAEHSGSGLATAGRISGEVMHLVVNKK